MLTMSASSCRWWICRASFSEKPIMGLSTRGIFGTTPVNWTFWTILRLVFRAFLDVLMVAVPSIIILMSPSGGLGRSLSRQGTCSWGGFALSLLMNFCNFPCLMRTSICCFKSKQLAVSWPWSWWKRQYLSLDHLLGSPFSLSGKIKAPSSLICIRA